MKVLSIRVGESHHMLQALLGSQRVPVSRTSSFKRNFVFLFLFAEDISLLAKVALPISNTDSDLPDPKTQSGVVQTKLPENRVRGGVSGRRKILCQWGGRASLTFGIGKYFP